MIAIHNRNPTDKVRTQPPTPVVPRPRSSPEGHPRSSSPQDADASGVDLGAPSTAGCPSLVAVMAVVCVLLALVVG